MILCNGIPKSGTHALARACGGAVVHIPFGIELPGGEHVFITRHPRNILCSYVRAQRLLPATAALKMALADFFGIPFADECRRYLGWLTSGVEVVRYEDLIVEPGGTLTWSGKPSDWTRAWTQTMDEAWAVAAMDEIQAAMGY